MNNKKTVIEEFVKKVGVYIEPCGVFVDEKLNYLIANPDGLIEDDGIIVIKYPFKVQDTDVKHAVKYKFIKYLKYDKNRCLKLKLNSEPYFHIQGELHITKRQYCYLIVWTSIGIFSQYLIIA